VKCAKCNSKKCKIGIDCKSEITKKVISEYKKEENKKLIEVSSYIEGNYYMKKNRIEELIEFCKMMNYTKLGISFCIGLKKECETLEKILSKDFKVYSVCCKVCGIDKKMFNLKQINENDRESMCNPIGQSMILNNLNTELNIILGLCIGHDILFQKYSMAPTTTLIVKDRVLAHNPVGALYSEYYLKKLYK